MQSCQKVSASSTNNSKTLLFHYHLSIVDGVHFEAAVVRQRLQLLIAGHRPH